MNSTGLPQALKRISRVPKHDTTKIIPSDGFNENKTTTKMSFVDPKTHKIQDKKILSMIHRYNLADLNLSDRSALMPVDTGFRNTIAVVEKPHWMTTTTSGYG